MGLAENRRSLHTFIKAAVDHLLHVFKWLDHSSFDGTVNVGRTGTSFVLALNDCSILAMAVVTGDLEPSWVWRPRDSCLLIVHEVEVWVPHDAGQVRPHSLFLVEALHDTLEVGAEEAFDFGAVDFSLLDMLTPLAEPLSLGYRLAQRRSVAFLVDC